MGIIDNLQHIVFILAIALPMLDAKPADNADNSHDIHKRQAEQVLDLIPIGDLVNTNHAVRGFVWAYNNSLLLIEDFGYDGTGFTVSMIASVKG